MSGARDKQRYRRFCAEEATVPLFSRDWWLDALVGPEGWDVALVEEQGEVVASLPFVIRSRYGFRWLSQPPLTQALGPWIRGGDGEEERSPDLEEAVLMRLIESLPPFDHFIQGWHYSRHNWLPFYWKGFSQTTRYTYILPDLSDEGAIWEGLRSNIRGDIRKAATRFGLKVRQDLRMGDLIPLVRMTFQRQRMRLPWPESILQRLYEACESRGCGRLFLAEDPDGRRHAGEYIVWDERSAYGLIAGADPEVRGSGATSLCRWEAIRFASKVTRCFDFEGSMLEPVERQFRAFGAQQKPYFRVRKTNSQTLQIALFFLALL